MGRWAGLRKWQKYSSDHSMPDCQAHLCVFMSGAMMNCLCCLIQFELGGLTFEAKRPLRTGRVQQDVLADWSINEMKLKGLCQHQCLWVLVLSPFEMNHI